MKVEWSREATIYDADGNGGNAFQLGTFAVRARVGDAIRVRLLAPGTARHPDLPKNVAANERVKALLVEQTEEVVVEPQPCPRPVERDPWAFCVSADGA